MRDSADALRLFLHAGANVDVNSLNGEPLLHVSVVRNNFKCTILLLAAGADVTARDGSGRTACFVAADFPTGTLMSFVHALLAVGADLDTADDSGQTPRMRLAERRVTVDPQQVESARHDIAKRDSTLCAIVQWRFALDSNHCNSMHCRCARFCSSRADHWRA
jgi:hypothetical protein